MHKLEGYFRDLLSEAIRSAVDHVVREHHSRLTQEHQLTSRIAETIEQRLKQLVFNGHAVKVIAQEMPDKGAGALEKRTGVDLYIALKIEGPITSFEKGLFIQAKWDARMRPADVEALVEQCEKILSHTKTGAFVWLYGPDGTAVVPAQEVVANSHIQPSDLSSNSVKELFDNVVNCVSGDRKLVMRGIFDSVDALNAMLHEFGVSTGVSIAVNLND